jgi:hypothetical protein
MGLGSAAQQEEIVGFLQCCWTGAWPRRLQQLCAEAAIIQAHGLDAASTEHASAPVTSRSRVTRQTFPTRRDAAERCMLHTHSGTSIVSQLTPFH